MEQLTFVGHFIWENFLQIWPYLLITIPLAVATNLSGASKYVNRALQARPLVAILLATAVGAFSPFCSCSVIPVVASLLIGGVPLAPVMAFWIASPSMDPEIFFLSVGVLGWELALWRLAGALVLSLAAGLLTHLMVGRGWFATEILRDRRQTPLPSTRQLLQGSWHWLKRKTAAAFTWLDAAPSAPVVLGLTVRMPLVPQPEPEGATASAGCSTGCCAESGTTCSLEQPSFRQRLWQETWEATAMVLRFMALAFLLEALILLFVPQEWILGLLGEQNRWAVPLAALLGVPVYTSNLTALPLIGGLLTQGMDPSAALAFLVAGPTTTLPAMAAVWGLVRRPVFALYVSYALVGAVLLGMIHALTIA